MEEREGVWTKFEKGGLGNKEVSSLNRGVRNPLPTMCFPVTFQCIYFFKTKLQHRQNLLACNFIKNKTPALVCSPKFYKIFKDTFSQNIYKGLLLVI